MIQCKPRGICSWNFVLDGHEHHASLKFNWVGEQGDIVADGAAFEVRKHGVFSGSWTLEQGGTSLVSAQKSSAFSRSFELRNALGDEALLLRAESPFARSFRLERSQDVIATIAPAHVFTRRASIHPLSQDWDFPTLAFAFWLVALTWRRAASRNSGGGAGG